MNNLKNAQIVTVKVTVNNTSFTYEVLCKPTEDNQTLFRKANIFFAKIFRRFSNYSFRYLGLRSLLSGIPDVAKDGVNILLFELSDTKKLSEKLKLIISDKSLSDTISNASVLFSLNQFSLDLITRQLKFLYLNNINKSSSF